MSERLLCQFGLEGTFDFGFGHRHGLEFGYWVLREGRDTAGNGELGRKELPGEI